MSPVRYFVLSSCIWVVHSRSVSHAEGIDAPRYRIIPRLHFDFPEPSERGLNHGLAAVGLTSIVTGECAGRAGARITMVNPASVVSALSSCRWQ
jgi:hypothetical protein